MHQGEEWVREGRVREGRVKEGRVRWVKEELCCLHSRGEILLGSQG